MEIELFKIMSKYYIMLILLRKNKRKTITALTSSRHTASQFVWNQKDSLQQATTFLQHCRKSALTSNCLNAEKVWDSVLWKERLSIDDNQEKFEDTKGVIRIRISKKNRQHNGPKKKYKKTNNDIQSIYIKLKNE